MENSELFEVKLVKKRMISGEVGEFFFEKPPQFSFFPGQFVQFRIPNDEKYVYRSYSMVSLPENENMEFCIKMIPGGKAAGFFQKLSVGDSAHVTAPKGNFLCNPDYNSIFIATGVGIAPIMPMIEQLCSLKKESELIFGFRAEENIFWMERIEELKKKNPSLRCKVTLSRGSDKWTGLRGRVTDHLSFIKDTHYYICGRVEMVKDVRKQLLDHGINGKNIHFEIF